MLKIKVNSMKKLLFVFIFVIFCINSKIYGQVVDPMAAQQEATQILILTNILNNAKEAYKIASEGNEILKNIEESEILKKAEQAEDAKEIYELAKDIVELSAGIVCMNEELYNSIELAENYNFDCYGNFEINLINRDLKANLGVLRYLVTMKNIRKALRKEGTQETIKDLENIKIGLEKSMSDMYRLKNDILKQLFTEGTLKEINASLERYIFIHSRSLEQDLKMLETKTKGLKLDYEKKEESVSGVTIESNEKVKSDIKESKKEIKDKVTYSSGKVKGMTKSIIVIILIVGLIFTSYNIATGNSRAKLYVLSYVIALIVASIAYSLIN